MLGHDVIIPHIAPRRHPEQANGASKGDLLSFIKPHNGRADAPNKIAFLLCIY